MATLWFCLVVITIASYVVLDGFDLGAGITHLCVARSAQEKDQVLSSIAPVWNGNEVWLLAAGGTLYFAFPTLFASAFSGFYLGLTIVLWLLILPGVSIEFRSHIENPVWKPFWSAVFSGASAMLAFLFGVVLGNVVRGVPLDADGYFFLPLWTNLKPGAWAGMIDWYTSLVGTASLLALAVHGSLWVALKTEGSLQERTRSFASKAWWGLVITTVVISLLSFAVQPNLERQFERKPWGVLFPALAVAGLIEMRFFSARRKDLLAFLASSVYLMGMLGGAAFGVFPNMLPSNTRSDLSLSIYNAATGYHGLVAGMAWWFVGMFLVTFYFVLAYYMFRGKVAVLEHRSIETRVERPL